jgi:hypothetical protein
MATKAATKLTNAMKNPADNKVATTAKLMIATKYRLICESNVASSKLELATVGAGDNAFALGRPVPSPERSTPDRFSAIDRLTRLARDGRRVLAPRRTGAYRGKVSTGSLPYGETLSSTLFRESGP